MSVLLADSQEALALGSATLLTVVSGDNTANQQLLKKLWQVIFQFERQFSRFLPSSELSTFNRNAGTWQPISNEFQLLLRAAKAMGEETDGLYNPFILPALQRAGYTKSFAPGFEDDAHDSHAGKTVVPVSKLELKPGKAFIPYGTALDLGGCGKGYLGDLLAEQVPDGVAGYCFSLGGDIVAGGVDAGGHPWTLAVEDISGAKTDTTWEAHGTKQRFAVATSGTAVRQGEHNGKKWHHIIDPRTQAPTETDVRLATVFDHSALRADVYASCAIIVGSDQAAEYLKKHHLPAALVQGERTSGVAFQFGYGKHITQRAPVSNIKVEKHA